MPNGAILLVNLRSGFCHNALFPLLSSRGITKFLMSYTKKPKQDSGLVFSRKHVNCCKKEQGMCDDERSESEFYYPEEGNLNVSLQNEKFEASEVLNNNEYTDSQKAINSFVNAQKSKNTVKKTTSDMNNFKSCCKKIKLVKK